MSMVDSIRLTIATMLSNAAGASVGMEAGYTQFGSAIFSSVSQYFRLRRDDARIYVTAGAAAAIAAAFNAPLAGAFYGFELVLGRSEEHTSELQSLMRISYAVFCLKKKKHTRTHDKLSSSQEYN